MFYDIAGWTGAFLILSAFFLLSTERLPQASRIYNTMNLLGAVGLLTTSLAHGAYPLAALNIFWGLIAIYGLYQSFTRKSSRQYYIGAI